VTGLSNSLRPDWRLGLPAESVRTRKRSRVRLRIPCALFRLRVRLSRLVYATWLVMRSSIGRILFLRSMFAGQPFLSFGAGLEVDSNHALVPSKRTNARTRDIQLLQQAYPWATAVDLHLFLLGWNKGEEFAGRDSRSGDFCSAQTTATA
jgi:hypothetical protein